MVGCSCGGRVEAPRAPDGTCGPSGRRPRTIAARPTGAGMTHTILVVEDEAKIRSLLRGYLERAGYSVLTTGSGAEALTLTSSASPDLILLDLGLPDVAGETIAREIRRARPTPLPLPAPGRPGAPGEAAAGEIRRAGPTPILILTAKAGEEDRIAGLELGA